MTGFLSKFSLISCFTTKKIIPTARTANLLLFPLMRAFHHNGASHHKTISIAKMPKQLGEILSAITACYIDKYSVSGCKAEYAINTSLFPSYIPALLMQQIIAQIAPLPHQQKEEIADFQNNICQLPKNTAPPVLLITGIPLKPIGNTGQSLRADIDNILYAMPGFHYNLLLQEIIAQSLMRLAPFTKNEEASIITSVSGNNAGSFRSAGGIPHWHIDAARQVDYEGMQPTIVSLTCHRGGGAAGGATEFIAAKDLFYALSPNSQKLLQQEYYRYQYIDDYTDSSSFAIFKCDSKGNVGIQLTVGHEIVTNHLENRQALCELKELLQGFDKEKEALKIVLQEGDAI